MDTADSFALGERGRTPPGMQRAAVWSLWLAVLLSWSCGGQTTAVEAEPFVAYIVRHAEPLYPAPPDAPEDPRLNVMGQDRADALARTLAPQQITAVYATERRRAQETAQPTAQQFELRVRTYDSNDLVDVVRAATQPGARTLIVGHSDTVSLLVATLGADPGEEIDANLEFDRLTLVVGTTGHAQRIDLRYGRPLPDDWRALAATRRRDPEESADPDRESAPTIVTDSPESQEPP